MQARERVRSWVHAFNRADVDALASFYTEDAVNHQLAESPGLRGCGFFVPIPDGP